MSGYVVHWTHPIDGPKRSTIVRTLVEARVLERAIKRRIGVNTRIEEV